MTFEEHLNQIVDAARLVPELVRQLRGLAWWERWLLLYGPRRLARWAAGRFELRTFGLWSVIEDKACEPLRP